MRTLRLLIFLMQLVFVTRAQDTTAVILVNSDSGRYDFGTIALGDRSQLAIQVRNIGNTAVTINGINSDAGSIRFKIDKKTIKPRKARYIYATYDANGSAVTGSFKNKATVSFVGISNICSFEITGAVVPAASMPIEQKPKHKATNNSPKAVARRLQNGTN